MKLVKWNNFNPLWPSVFDDEDTALTADWLNFSSSRGIDIYETDDAVVVEASVPGIPEDKIEVSIEGNILMINAENVETEEDKKKKKSYKSTRQTSFSYSASLPRMVDSTNAKAEVENGVIRVTVPKAEAEKPKKITVTKK